MAERPVVLVTGAARRLGREIALDLAAHGYDIAVHYRHASDEALATVDLVRRAGAGAAGFAADLADEAACRALVPAVVARFGRLDAIVNNASTFEYDDAFHAGPASMEFHWRANTAAPVLLAQALHAHLGGTPRTGCVVNLLDQKLWNLNPDHFSYTLSKAALQTATVMLAQAMAPRLRVCGVAPGLTLPSHAMTQARFEALHKLTPLGCSSKPEDIARSVRFLIESPSITGTTLLVDGGQHLLGQARDVVFVAAGGKEG